MNKTSLPFAKILFALLFISNISFGQTYLRWIGASGGTWSTSTNWSPTGIPDATTEVAVFDGFSGTVIVNSNPTIGGLSVVGGNLVLQNENTNNSRTITLNGQFSALNELNISNSTVQLLGRTGFDNFLQLTIADNANNEGQILNSILNSSSTDGSVNRRGALVNVNTSRLTFDNTSSYVHSHNQGTIPTATWQSGSICSVTGITVGSPSMSNPSFSNFVWNTPNNTGTRALQSSSTITGTFTLENTGTGSLSLTNGNGNVRTHLVSNFIQNGGVLSFVINSPNANSGTIGQLLVSETFIQNAGVITSLYAGVASNRIIINGTTNQNIALISMTGGDFEVNKTSGTALLQNNTSLPANLVLTAGDLQIGNNTLTMAAATGVITSTNGKLIGGNTSNLALASGATGFTLPTITGGLFNLYSARTTALVMSEPLTIAGALTVAGTFTVGANTLNYNPSNYIGTGAQIATTSASTLEINGTGGVISVPGGVTPRQLGFLTVNNANDIILGSNTNIANGLTINNGAIILGANNLSVGGVVNGSFSNTAFVNQSGTGRLLKTYTSLPSSFIFPIGTGNYYSGTYAPLNITSLSATAPPTGYISVVDRTTPPAIVPTLLAPDYAIKRYWTITAPGLSNVNASFIVSFTGADLSTSSPGVNYFTAYNVSPSATWSLGLASEVSTLVSNFNLVSASALSGNYTVGNPSAFIASTLYSYQNGNWNDPNVWTLDPSGSTLVSPQVPVNSSQIFILNGRTISLSADVNTTGHGLVINAGGTLDLKTFALTTLAGLSGQGLLRLNSTSFPVVASN
ncbi:MAG: beta strand repeat-containing protein, partial [Cytophagales bacterium]